MNTAHEYYLTLTKVVPPAVQPISRTACSTAHPAAAGAAAAEQNRCHGQQMLEYQHLLSTVN